MQNNFVAVPMSVELFARLLSRTSHPHSLIEEVLESFLERTEEDFAPRKNRGNGLAWENLYLPEKTKLRTKHHGEYKYADVKNDHVSFDGDTFTSVGAAINEMRGGTSNNAWKVTQVLRPTDSEWQDADRLRR